MILANIRFPARFIQIINIVQDSFKYFARQVLPEKFLQEMHSCSFRLVFNRPVFLDFAFVKTWHTACILAQRQLSDRQFRNFGSFVNYDPQF